MTNALVGYIIGKYANDSGTYADFNEILLKGFNWEEYRTPEVERFLAIQELVARLDVVANKAFSALQIQLVPLFNGVPEDELPFYFLPLAHLRGACFRDVVELTSLLVTRLTTDAQIIEQVLCLVSAIKWSLTTKSSYYPFVQRCFSTLVNSQSSASLNLVREALSLDQDVSFTQTTSESPVQVMLQKACRYPTHVAIRCAMVYALAETFTTEVSKSEKHQLSDAIAEAHTSKIARNGLAASVEDFSQPFPLRPRLTSHKDAHIIDGFYRLDGYVAWVMKSKKEPLLDRSILGDEDGPNQDDLRFWNFCNKHLDWDQLAHELDRFFSIRSFLRVDWRSQFVRHEIQWDRQRVGFVLNNDRCLSFVPDAKKNTFILDKSEAKNAGIPRFRFGTRPGISLLEDFTDKLMTDDDSNL